MRASARRDGIVGSVKGHCAFLAIYRRNTAYPRSVVNRQVASLFHNDGYSPSKPGGDE